jgi:hypothetical protein
LYGIETFNLNKAIKRNLERFPDDFMFRLTEEEVRPLIFQIGISKKKGRGGRRHSPYVFTEQGVAMLSSVLNSDRAIRVNIAIMRAFVKLREMMLANKGSADKLHALERKVEGHDNDIHSLFDTIERMTDGHVKRLPRIGFKKA